MDPQSVRAARRRPWRRHQYARRWPAAPLDSADPLAAVGRRQSVLDRRPRALTCVDARSGEERWHKRLAGEFSASPVLADGRIYLVNEDAATTVLAAGNEFELLATNPLEGRALASPAICGRAIYLRTDQHLYKIAGAAADTAARRPAAQGSKSE